MKKIQLLFSIFFLLLIFNSCTTKDQEERLPNIVIIFTDDQGYQDLSCYGSPNIRTPNIDKIATDGIKFTNFYVAQPVCSASRAALLTGCYPNRLGIHGAYSPYVGKGLNPNEETIAEVLKPLGYATAIYGKWHLGSEPELLPTRQGFDEYFGIPYSNDMWPYHPWQGSVFNFPDLPLLENETVIDTLHEQSQITKWYTEKAVQFIEKNKDRPFFLYVPHSMPHVPLYASDDFKGKSKAGIYGDVIEEIDWSTGEIAKTLGQHNLSENTLIIFTSDNGPWLSYGTHSGVALPLREGKGTALEGGVRVPCVMSWPNKIEKGQVIKKPAMSIDLLPTIAKLTQATLPQNIIDGKDMSALLFDEANALPHHDAYYFYYHQNELHGILSGDGKWKMYLPHRYRTLDGRQGTSDGLPIDYVYKEMGTELYDLENDISETTNVAKDHPDIINQLMVHAENARMELGDKLTDRTGTGTRLVGLVNQ